MAETLTSTIENRMHTKLQDGRADILVFIRDNPGTSSIKIAQGLPNVRNIHAKLSQAQALEQIEPAIGGKNSWRITKKGQTWIDKWERENQPRKIRPEREQPNEPGNVVPFTRSQRLPEPLPEELEPEFEPADTCARCNSPAQPGSRVTWAGSTWCCPECMALDLGLHTADPPDDKVRLPLEGLDASFEVQITLKRGDQAITLLQLCEEKYQEGRRHGFQAGHAHALQKLKALTVDLEECPPASARGGI